MSIMPTKILIADDSTIIRWAITSIFSEPDYIVNETNNAQNAIEKLNEFIPDIFMTDINLPDKNGFEICKTIKENEKLSNIPIILLGNLNENEASKFIEFKTYSINKPFESKEIMDLVIKIINEKNSIEEIINGEEVFEEVNDANIIDNTQDIDSSTPEELPATNLSENEFSFNEPVAQDEQISEPEIQQQSELSFAEENQQISTSEVSDFNSVISDFEIKQEEGQDVSTSPAINGSRPADSGSSENIEEISAKEDISDEELSDYLFSGVKEIKGDAQESIPIQKQEIKLEHNFSNIISEDKLIQIIETTLKPILEKNIARVIPDLAEKIINEKIDLLLKEKEKNI